MALISWLPFNMQYFDLTFPTPQQNLACDEALVTLCEGGYGHEILRVWEPREHFVVLGYSNRIPSEVDLPACQRNLIPIFRRRSGGGTVLQGPGCLNYTLILRIANRGPLSNISGTNSFIMGRHQRAMEHIIGSGVKIQGFTDLAMQDLKFSGNAQYRRRRYLMFHGAFLLDFDLALMEKVLRVPDRQPRYRRNRPHVEFVTNLHIPAARLKQALRETWGAATMLPEAPTADIDRLAEERYASQAWIYRS